MCARPAPHLLHPPRRRPWSVKTKSFGISLTIFGLTFRSPFTQSPSQWRQWLSSLAVRVPASGSDPIASTPVSPPSPPSSDASTSDLAGGKVEPAVDALPFARAIACHIVRSFESADEMLGVIRAHTNSGPTFRCPCIMWLRLSAFTAGHLSTEAFATLLGSALPAVEAHAIAAAARHRHDGSVDYIDLVLAFFEDNANAQNPGPSKLLKSQPYH